MAELTADQCEEIFHAALRRGDARGVEAALTLLAALDPRRAASLFDQIRLALSVALRAAGAPITEGETK